MKQRLTKEQGDIVEDIRLLYKDNVPLNITAVKRSHPELIQAVYRIKPFWGWKQAIEDAGLDYSRLRVQLLDEVQCRICGARLQSVGVHLHKIHSCTGEDYYRDYPDADIFAETLRARMFGRWRGRSDRSLTLVPHWEPIWSAEYVLDRTACLHDQGIPVSFQFLHTGEASLLSAGAKYFGSWESVLRRIGLDPDRVLAEAPRDTWAVPNLERNRAHFPCKFKRKDRQDLLAAVRRVAKIEDSEQREVEIIRLRSRFRGHAMYFYSGMWGRIADAAGVDPSRIRGKGWKYLTRADVVAEIKARHDRGLDLKSNETEKGKHADGALYYRGLDLFASWDAAVGAAGLTVKRNPRCTRPSPYQSNDDVTRAIRKRLKTKESLVALGLQTGTFEDRRLLNAGVRFFGKWSTALRAAGLEAARFNATISRRKYADPKALLRALKARERKGLSMSSVLVSREDRSLVRWACNFFGTWSAALEQAECRKRHK